MSITHRAIASAASGAVDHSDNLSCSPWEGPYLDQNKAFATPGNATSKNTSRGLETFLTTLMYGE